MLVSYLGSVRVKIRVLRVSGAVRAFYSLPGDLTFALSIYVLEFQNTSYGIISPFILYPGFPGSVSVIKFLPVNPQRPFRTSLFAGDFAVLLIKPMQTYASYGEFAIL